MGQMPLVQPGGLLQYKARRDFEAGRKLLPIDLPSPNSSNSAHRPTDDLPQCLIFCTIPLDLRRVNKVSPSEWQPDDDCVVHFLLDERETSGAGALGDVSVGESSRPDMLLVGSSGGCGARR